jgi:two-component system, OmpR family, response regulator
MNEPDPSKVLIVDDEADICFLFGRILRRRNLTTGFAGNLAEAKESIQADPPSLIFLDNCLPDGRGVDFIPFIKKNYPQTQIVMITADDTVSDKRRAIKQGADDFLGKPLSVKLINGTLDRMMPLRDPV